MVQIFLTCVYWFTTHVHCYINSICETCRTIACWKVHIQGFQLHKGKHEIRVKSAKSMLGFNCDYCHILDHIIKIRSQTRQSNGVLNMEDMVSLGRTDLSSVRQVS